ncbi:MAG TPA: tripartite tricarboxylate transporter TctB family protein [Candidatus Binatia bacterium]
MKIRPAAIFSFCALIFFCVFVYQAHEWRMQARLYPWAIGIPMLILAIVQVIFDLKGVKAKESTDAAPVDFQFTQTVEPAIAKKRAITMFAWLFGFFVAVLLVGFSIAIPLMMFTYMKFQGKESWVLSLILTVIAFGFYYMLFVKVLNLPFPEGLLLPWLGLSG